MPFIQGLAESIGHGPNSDSPWEVLPDTLVKMPATMVENPRAGLKKPDGTAEPAKIPQDTGRWMIQFKTPEGVTRAVELTSPDITERGLQVGAPGIDAKLHGNWQVASEPRDVPQNATTPAEENARVATAQANADRAKSEAQIAADNLKQVQEANKERDANAAAGRGWVSNEDLRKIQQDAAQNNLNQQQIDARLKEIENNNRNTARSNEIAAINASTAAANAETAARRELAQTKYEEGQLDLDNMKFEHQKAQDEISNRNAETKIQLDQLAQQQANEIAQGTLGARREEAAETARSNAAQLQQRQLEQQQNLEQRQAEMRQTGETAATTAATTAAANVFGTERQAQTAAGAVGQNLLANRATATNNLLQNILSGAAGLSQGSAGRYGTLGGGLQAPLPAGFGAGLVSGAMGVTGQQFGGQETLDAAARMVRGAAPGAELTPYGQAAIGVLQQMFERFGQLNGAPHPAAAASAAAASSAANGGVTAPVTQGNQPTVTAYPQTSPLGGGVANSLGGTMQTYGPQPETAEQSMQRNQGFTAPAPPTVTLNMNF